MKLDVFKIEIEEYVKTLFALILEDYSKYLPKEKIELLENFNYDKDIIIDSGGKYSKCPGRFENGRLALAVLPFYENVFKRVLDNDIPYMDINDIESKLKDSANNSFTGKELSSYIKQKKLSCLDVIKGIVIHEVFHAIITLKDRNEVYMINYEDKDYACRGVIGEYLEEGLVEYYARKFASKHDLFILPSIPYQDNVEYAKKIEQEFGKNIYLVLFKYNYKTLLNYVHKVGWINEYHNAENKWLKNRLRKRIANKKELDAILDFNVVEELKLT